MNTETLDKLYLEISQFTTAKTARDIETERLLGRATMTHRKGTGEFAPTISLLFETDEDAEAAFDLLMRLRGESK